MQVGIIYNLSEIFNLDPSVMLRIFTYTCTKSLVMNEIYKYKGVYIQAIAPLTRVSV